MTQNSIATPLDIIVCGEPWDLAVQRDMEVIREIIAEVETWTDTTAREISLAGHDAAIVQAHVSMMQTAGLIVVTDHWGFDDGDHFLVTDLTWSGHELAAALRTPTVWKSMKSKLGPTLMSLPLAAISQISVSLATEWAKQQLGLGD